MRLFKRQDDSFTSIPGVAFSDDHLERHLEDWVESCSALVGNLLILGRQIRTERNKPMDLLALDENGDTVIIELKRASAPRELVGQVADYLSSVRRWKARDLEKRANPTLAPWSLPKMFQEKFKREPPEDFNRNQRVVVMVESIDGETLDQLMTIREVEVITFSYFKDDKSEYILIRDSHNAAPAPMSRATRARAEVATQENTPEDAEQLTKNAAFLQFYEASLAPAIKRDIFKPQDGWRFGRSREDGAVYIHHADWGSSWEGFVVGLQPDESEPGDIWLGLWMAAKRGEPLISELRPQEEVLRESLGRNFRFGDDPNGDGVQFPIWEPGHTRDNAKLVLEKLAAYKNTLLPSVKKIMDSKRRNPT